MKPIFWIIKGLLLIAAGITTMILFKAKVIELGIFMIGLGGLMLFKGIRSSATPAAVSSSSSVKEHAQDHKFTTGRRVIMPHDSLPPLPVDLK